MMDLLTNDRDECEKARAADERKTRYLAEHVEANVTEETPGNKKVRLLVPTTTVEAIPEHSGSSAAPEAGQTEVAAEAVASSSASPGASASPEIPPAIEPPNLDEAEVPLPDSTGSTSRQRDESAADEPASQRRRLMAVPECQVQELAARRSPEGSTSMDNKTPMLHKPDRKLCTETQYKYCFVFLSHSATEYSCDSWGGFGPIGHEASTPHALFGLMYKHIHA